MSEKWNAGLMEFFGHHLFSNPPGHFKHFAFYNRREKRIEMHLKAERSLDNHSPLHPFTNQPHHPADIFIEDFYYFLP